MSSQYWTVISSGKRLRGLVPFTLLDSSVSNCLYRRIDIGGKLLTNHLKELVSYRQWNMMDETYIINDVKEACCYVSTDFAKDMETCRYVPTLK